MTLDFDAIISIFTLLASGAALLISWGKTRSEKDKLDADTIDSLFDTIEKQKERAKEAEDANEERYCELKKEFETYKRVTTSQIAALSQENTRISHENSKLRRWAEKLVKQLQDANITPLPYE